MTRSELQLVSQMDEVLGLPAVIGIGSGIGVVVLRVRAHIGVPHLKDARDLRLGQTDDLFHGEAPSEAFGAMLLLGLGETRGP